MPPGLMPHRTHSCVRKVESCVHNPSGDRFFVSLRKVCWQSSAQSPAVNCQLLTIRPQPPKVNCQPPTIDGQPMTD